MQRNRKIKLLFKISLVCLSSIVLFFLIWPSSFFYLVVLIAPGSFPYHSAVKIGENGSIFFIRQGLNSSDPKVRSLMISTAMGAYLNHHGGTEEIWELIVYTLSEPTITRELTIVELFPLENYIYGHNVPVAGPQKVARKLYFPVERIRWANVNIYNRPPDYWIPAEIFDPSVHKAPQFPDN